MSLQEQLKQLFPFPVVEQLKLEAQSNLPFPCFGRSGGYGLTRRNLRKAIEDSDLVTAETKYYELIVEGLESDQKDAELWEGPCPFSYPELVIMMAESINNLGHEKS
jgi:hypothetical protein